MSGRWKWAERRLGGAARSKRGMEWTKRRIKFEERARSFTWRLERGGR